MRSEGINVNNAKKIIYFLLATDPLTFILFLIELDISLNIIIKKSINRPIFKYRRQFKLLSLKKIKVFPMNIKKVKNDTVSGIDKEIVGNEAAKIRSIRPPEPYKGKGIKYQDERIIRKAGKSGKK